MRNRERERIAKAVLKNMEKNGTPFLVACEAAGISHQTFYAWKKMVGFEWIAERLKEISRTTQENKVTDIEKSLFTRAIGYLSKEREYRSKEIINPDGTKSTKMVLHKEVVKPIGGNITAIIFALRNLAREGMTTIDWQNVYDITIDRSDVKSVDELIKQVFRNSPKEKDSKDGKTSAKFTPLRGESKEEAALRRSISVEMQN